MSGVAGRLVLATGAGRGLGRAYAERLACRGARLAVADIDVEAARVAAGAMCSQGHVAEPFEVDVTEPAAVHRLVGEVTERLGEVDVLINNAGGLFAPWGPMELVDPAAWARTLAVNLTGTWLCSCAVVPAMKRRGSGTIVNVSTTMVSRGTPVGGAAYVAAKGGVVGLTRALAKELGPFGIRVNAIAPGLVPGEKAAEDPDKAAILEHITEEVVSQQSVPRVGSAADLCGAVEFLVSDESAFISGQVLHVDGGWALA